MAKNPDFTNYAGTGGSECNRLVTTVRSQSRQYNRVMDASGISAIRSVGFLLLLVLLFLAPKAIFRSPLRLKAALHILAGMAAGVAAGIAVGAPSGSGELGGHLAFLLMLVGGIWVSVRKIRRARSARRYGWPR